MKFNYIFLLALFIQTSHSAEITVMGSCSQRLSEVPIYTALDSSRNTLSGWSHIDTSTTQYQSLKLMTSDYKISQENYNEVQECNNKVQNAILVGKISDWSEQHSNGFEALLDQPNIHYGDITHVLIDLKINSRNTVLPSQELLKSRYGQFLENSELTQLDQSRVNLNLTLFTDDSRDQTTNSFNAEYLIDIDQKNQADQWLRIVLPLSEFNTFTQQNYVSKHVKLSDYNNEAIFGIRIVAETVNGKQLRNLIDEQWSNEIQESFKEVSLSLSRIELLNL